MPHPFVSLDRDGFLDFYSEVHGRPPFLWQVDLARQTFDEGWPDVIDVPTASGKTAAIDIAVYAAALSAVDETVAIAARRIFFTVDRRQVVSQAFAHAQVIAERLWKAADNNSDNQPEILRRVAACLLKLGGNFNRQPPLDARELRGGIFRDDAWVRSPTQPTVLATTVDQIGSRMLFRGYGVSNRNLPIHAAMTATDALILLDEAHCSVPFLKTVGMIQHYQSECWADVPLVKPLRLVQMSATNFRGDRTKQPFRLTEAHYAASEKLRQRHEASKPIKLVLDDKAKATTPVAKIAKTLVYEAMQLAGSGCRRVAVIVNRIGIAKAVHQILSKDHDAELLIGRMRPIDRDALAQKLNQRFASGSQIAPNENDAPAFLVATQTIEVGVDYDFDGIVSQCASLDALIQRFGRLNRVGSFPHAHGTIVANVLDATPADKWDATKPLDPIYQNASSATWHFLQQHRASSDGVDFGVRVDGSVLADDVIRPLSCIMARETAPALMPSHLDMLVQTSPRPTLEPDVAIYLHGLGPDGTPSGQPMVQLCWRSDLILPNGDWDPATTEDPINRFRHVQPQWKQAVEVCPPTVSECMSVPLREFQRWMMGQTVASCTGDVEGEIDVEDDGTTKSEANPRTRRVALVWRGSDRSEVDSANAGGSRGTVMVGGEARDVYRNVQPNDTVVLPAVFGGWNELGTVPDPILDPAEDWKGIAKLLARQASVVEQERIDHLLDNIKHIDIADRAYYEKRGRNLLRLHPSLPLDSTAKGLLQWIKADVATKGIFNIRVNQARQILSDLMTDDDVTSEPNSPSAAAPVNPSWQRRLLTRLAAIRPSCAGQLNEYPGGYVWTTGIDQDKQTGIPPLPLESFDDQLESRSGIEAIELMSHTADVIDVTRMFSDAIGLSPAMSDQVRVSALWHDVGKADPRFQSLLLGQPVAVARFSPKLLAKSACMGQLPFRALPVGFRHETLSAEVFQLHVNTGQQSQSGHNDLTCHLIASHHGFARPYAPVCVDQEQPDVDFSPLGGPLLTSQTRSLTRPAHHLDSGVSDRFWRLNRRFGAWGLAQLEAILRLSDWFASANPGVSDEQPRWSWRSTNDHAELHSTNCGGSKFRFDGIDGANPLGFLTAIGLFRMLDRWDGNEQLRFGWRHHDGTWRPVVSDRCGRLKKQEDVLDALSRVVIDESTVHPALTDCPENLKRHAWFAHAAFESSCHDREMADWLTCNGSDALGVEAISQLQTSRRDYHAIAINGLLKTATSQHFLRAMFQPWDYADPIAGVSLHLEPREDRRHAYQWHKPSGDPTRKVSGGMIGANRLALEAWPMFQSLPQLDRMQTVGFRGLRVRDTTFLWPIWEPFISIATLRSLLNSHQSLDLPNRLAIGITQVYGSKRILVGKTPNLTPAVAVG